MLVAALAMTRREPGDSGMAWAEGFLESSGSAKKLPWPRPFLFHERIQQACDAARM
jgi:hypothetical protein